MKINRKDDKIFKIVSYFCISMVAIVCLIPFLLVVSISLSSEVDIAQYGYSLIPKTFDFTAYSYFVKNPMPIINAYGVTIFVTLVGTTLSLIITSMSSYALSRKDFIFKGKMTMFFFFTMLFNGGMVPWYIMITKFLNLGDTIWVLILPTLVNVWNMFLLKTFFTSIPDTLAEAAKIDGACEYGIYFKIMLPLCKSGVATITLLTLLAYWNDWYLSMLFITKSDYISLQLMLQKVMGNVEFIQKAAGMGQNINIDNMPSETLRMATCVLAAGPMILIFPFFQKYFVQGLAVGAVKG